MRKIALKFPFVKPVMLLGTVILMVTLACGGSPSAPANPPDDSFSYPIRVLKDGTNEYVPNATVTIEVSGLAPLQGLTDTNGFARIFIDTSYVKKPARILIVANNYEPYRREIDLVKDTLPDTIPLTLTRNETMPSPGRQASTPIATQVMQETSPNASEPSVDLTGKWDFWFKGYRSIDENGTERNQTWDHRAIMELSQTGGRIIGEYLDATTAKGTVCKQANISGTIEPDRKIELTVQFYGSCCDGSKVAIEGELIENDKIIGMSNPLGAPLPDPRSECNTWWANIEGNRVN
ncbi:MAG: hypothetical protein KDJ97_19395 [Anaerolineae bacterium]|nr:hypothetical protein [Anaerolineae bacterium]